MNDEKYLSSAAGAGKLPGLDHLRSLAIILVLLFHYQLFGHPKWIETAGSFGWTGVDLFFVLSGFLIASQLFSSLSKTGRIPFRDFFIKRFFRIIPPFLLVLALYVFIPFFRERESLPPLWRFLTFTQNFGLDLSVHGTFSHAWSLCIEEQFYLLLPFLLYAFHGFQKIRYPVALLIALLVLIILIRWICWQLFVLPSLSQPNFFVLWHKFIYYPTYTRLDGLLVGVALAYGWVNYIGVRKFIVQRGRFLLLMGMIIVALAVYICLDRASFLPSMYGFTIVAIAYGFLVAASISTNTWLGKLRWQLTEQLAGLSYAVYLSHKGVIHITQVVLGRAGMDINSNLMLVCCVIACLIAALLLRYLVERPALTLRNKVLKSSGGRQRFASSL